jgi:hypothetical protein
MIIRTKIEKKIAKIRTKIGTKVRTGRQNSYIWLTSYIKIPGYLFN